MHSGLSRAKMWFAVPLALVLAITSGAHALSSTSARLAPDLASTMFPGNGDALERLAYGSFIGKARNAMASRDTGAGRDEAALADINKQPDIDQAELQVYAADAAQSARAALRYEPLLPRAHAILALSEADRGKKGRIINLASRLNRRDVVLQGVVLQSEIDDQDSLGTIATLDQILRVRPERGDQFYPLLTEALTQEVTVPQFVELLAKPVPWGESFLNFAVRNPAALQNLASVRKATRIDNSDFDRRLIANLAAAEDMNLARDIYELITDRASGETRAQWASDYPPFDWSFADEARFRAQESASGDQLDFAVEPGHGGVLASRVVRVPQSRFVVSIPNTLEPAASRKDVKLVLTCWGSEQPFFEAPFRSGEGIFEVGSSPGCAHVQIAITARSWTGSSSVSGSLEQARVEAR